MVNNGMIWDLASGKLTVLRTWKWPIEISLIYPLVAWWFSSALCKRLPEGTWKWQEMTMFIKNEHEVLKLPRNLGWFRGTLLSDKPKPVQNILKLADKVNVEHFATIKAAESAIPLVNWRAKSTEKDRIWLKPW